MQNSNTIKKLIYSVVASGLMAGFGIPILGSKAAVIDWSTAGSPFDTTDPDGNGNAVNNSDFLIAGWFGANSWDMHTVWSFQMTGLADGSLIANADFSVTVQGLPGSPSDFDLDLHVIRIDGNSSIVAADYETSAQEIEADFWTSADGTGSISLEAGGQAALTSYLRSNWSQGDYIFIGAKTAPTPTSGSNRYVSFGDGNISNGANGGPITDAQLTVALIPEPSTLALLAIGSALLFARRRRA